MSFKASLGLETWVAGCIFPFHHSACLGFSADCILGCCTELFALEDEGGL